MSQTTLSPVLKASSNQQVSFDVTGLKDFQHEPARFIYEHLQANRVIFNGSDTGTGKTYMATAVLREMVKNGVVERVFIVTTKATRSDWKKVSEAYGINPIGIVNYELLVRGGTPFVKWVENKDPLSREDGYYVWKLPKNTIIIFDEAHKCRSEKSLSGKLLRAAKMQDYMIHMMSATVAMSPLEMYNIGFVLGLHDGTRRNFNKWCMSNGAQAQGYRGNLKFDKDNDINKMAMKRIHDRLVKENKLVRVKRADLGDAFPRSTITARAIDFGDQTDKIRRVYENMEEEIARLNESAKDYSDHTFAQQIKARRLTELLKVPTTIELVKDDVEEGKSVIVFVNFQDTVTAMTKRLARFNVSYIVGGQSEKERNAQVARFQDGSVKIIIVNLAAGGTGVNLHDLTGKHERRVYMFPSWSAINMIQGFGRAWRQGGGFSLQDILFAMGTIEEEICVRIQDKIANLAFLNDGSLDDSDLMFE